MTVPRPARMNVRRGIRFTLAVPGQPRKIILRTKRTWSEFDRTSHNTSQTFLRTNNVADTLTRLQRSKRMSLVRSLGNRSTELRLASLFRKNQITGWRRHAGVFGKPDFVFQTSRVAIFVDGCFWHCCPLHSRTPKTRIQFWKRKLTANVKRDRLVARKLRALGWCVIRIRECELSKQGNESQLRRIVRAVKARQEGVR